MINITTIYYILYYLLYIIPISMLFIVIKTGEITDQLVIQTLILLGLIILTFEILYNKNKYIPKDLCKELIKPIDIKNTYTFNEECQILAIKVFYWNAAIVFGILFIDCVLFCVNIIIQIILLIATIISISRALLLRR